MGLFDGWSPTELTGSGAELAVLLDAPVLLVVDAGGMARTAAAVVHGLATFDPRVRVTGVIFNRVGGEGHTRILREAMAAALPGVMVLGGLPARPDLAVPERHLELVAAVAVVSAGRRVRIGVAQDAAFHFYYADNLDLLEEAGAELVSFSPVTDARPPPVDGLYLGGGYPEEHAAALTANVSMRASIRAFAASGGAIYAECGGLMYLGDSLEDAAGLHPMCGVLPLTTRMTSALRSFGYRDVVTTAETLFGPVGTRWKGRVLGTYVHAHFGSNGGMADAFVGACARLPSDRSRPT